MSLHSWSFAANCSLISSASRTNLGWLKKAREGKTQNSGLSDVVACQPAHAESLHDQNIVSSLYRDTTKPTSRNSKVGTSSTCSDQDVYIPRDDRARHSAIKSAITFLL